MCVGIISIIIIIIIIIIIYYYLFIYILNYDKIMDSSIYKRTFHWNTNILLILNFCFILCLFFQSR